MLRNTFIAAAIAAGLVLVPGASQARVGVEVWTDRGQDAVYKPGDLMQVKVRPSTDAYLLVYEIDTEGYVHVLFPERGQSGFVEGRRTLRLPDEESAVELVVEKSTGEAYIVAVASERPFAEMPWYLRPYDARSEGVEYEGQPGEEDGVTGEGRIVGDPFVAMERIRRKVLDSPEDPESFGSAYTSYYVHERVRYPRYLCYDCHRPNRWAWWDGFDPYYTTCSVVDFRINWGWSWGPTYWFGHTPYFCYVVRPDCDPRWRRHWDGPWYSSWDGHRRWDTMWGGPLVRYKTPPPPGYVPPNKYNDPDRWRGRDAVPLPPGFLANSGARERYRPMVPIGRNRQPNEPDLQPSQDARTPRVGTTGRPGVDRMPGREVRPGEDPGTIDRPGRGERPQPSGTPRDDGAARRERGSERPSPAYQPRESRPAPESAPPRSERAPKPRDEKRAEKPSKPPPPPPAPAPSRGEGSRGDGSRGDGSRGDGPRERRGGR